MLRHKRTQGQALVEFALAATLIFFLLAAAVDVGMIFFALQGMHNAAQEGAAYGSRWGVDIDNSTGAVILKTSAIIDHVRGESGGKGGNGFINLYDLNGNGIDDAIEYGYADPDISITFLTDPSSDGDPTLNVATGAAENTLCPDPTTNTLTCYIQVTVRSVHKMLFPFAPAFARNVPLTSSYIMPMRLTITRGTGTTTTVAQCVVPNLVTQSTNTATGTWAGAGFTGTLSFSGPSSSLVKTQQYASGTLLDCIKGMSVVRG